MIPKISKVIWFCYSKFNRTRVHTICSNNNRALQKVHLQVGLTIQNHILHFFFMFVFSWNNMLIVRKNNQLKFCNRMICKKKKWRTWIWMVRPTWRWTFWCALLLLLHMVCTLVRLNLLKQNHDFWYFGDQGLYKEVSMRVNLLFFGHFCIGIMLWWVGRKHGSCSWWRFGLVCLQDGIENIQESCSQILSYKCQKEVFLAVFELLTLLVPSVFNFWNCIKQYFDVFLEGELLDEKRNEEKLWFLCC